MEVLVSALRNAWSVLAGYFAGNRGQRGGLPDDGQRPQVDHSGGMPGAGDRVAANPTTQPDSAYRPGQPRRLSPQGRADITRREGCILRAYPDPATGGEPWTIGVGHTGGVKPGDVITQAQADDLLRVDVALFERAVSDSVRVPLRQDQFDALVSFTFNVGAGAFRGSTLLTVLNAGNYVEAADQIMRWNRAAGKIMVGLSKRRAEESAPFRV